MKESIECSNSESKHQYEILDKSINRPVAEKKCVKKSKSSTCSRLVEFSESMRVVLIPSRTDYMAAGLIKNLWWTAPDYLSFQQSAYSEIRLLSVFEGIDPMAAKQKLYGIGSSSMDSIYESLGNLLGSSASSSQSEESDSDKPNRKKYDVEETPGHETNIATASNSEELISTVSLESKSNKIAQESISKADDLMLMLTLCVPLQHYIPLLFKERKSRKQKSGFRFEDFSSLIIALMILIFVYNFPI